MKTIIKFIKVDWKSVLCTRNIMVMGLITIVVLIFVQSGIFKFDNFQKDKKEFQEVERLKVESYKRIEEFGIIGLKLIRIPEPTVIFFVNSTINFELISHINSADVLDMDQSSLGKKLFADRKEGFKDFSGIIILLVSLAVLFLGINSISHLEFRKSLATISGPVKMYLLLILSRSLLIVLFLSLITVCSVLLVLLNGIPLPSLFYSHMSGFFALMVGVIIFFYALGTFLGTLPNRASSILLGIVLWFVLLFLVPEGINLIVEKQADRIASNYRYELDKLRHEMGFEDRAVNEVGEYDPVKKHTKQATDLIDSYLLKEAKSIEKLEQEREAAMRNLLQTRKKLSLVFPTSFYLSTAHSVSSGGYESSIDFYRYTYQLKSRFIRWYIKQRYGKEGGKPAPFIKGDENIFYSKSCMGDYFTPGLTLTYVYASLLFLFAFLRLKNEMYSMTGQDINKVSGKDIKLKKKKFSPWKTNGDQLKNLLFVLLSGKIKKLLKMGYKGKITIDNNDISETGYNDKFFYICRPADVPEDIKTGDLLSLTTSLMKLPTETNRDFMKRPEIQPHLGKKFKELKDQEKNEILLSLTDLENYPLYLVNDTAAGLSRDFFLSLNDRMEELAKKGTTVIYLSSVYIPVKEKENKDREKPFFPDNSWEHDIALIRRKNKIKSGE